MALRPDPPSPLPSTSAAPPPLLARVAEGDGDAIREVIARYGNLVWSLARRFDPADAEDAVQEIFLDLWKSAARYDPAVAPEATFVAMIARRRLIDRRRTLARRPAGEALESTAPPVDAGLAPELGIEAARAAQALEQLRPEQRHVLVLATCEGLSHGEIAQRTGMPLGTVKAHLRRGLLAMRALLGERGEAAS